MDQIQIGKFIAACRKAQGLTQAQLAEQLNITDRAVSKWETGRGFPDVSLLEPLGSTLQVSIQELLYGQAVRNTNRSAGS